MGFSNKESIVYSDGVVVAGFTKLGKCRHRQTVAVYRAGEVLFFVSRRKDIE